MEMKLDSDHEVRLDISGGADCKNSISGNHPNNRDDVQCLHHDPADHLGLRSRKKVAAKTDLITTTSQSQQLQVEEVTGQLKTKSSSIQPAIVSNSQTENIEEVSVTAVSPSEILETLEAASPVKPRTPSMASPGKANDDDENGHSSTRKILIKVLSVIEFSLFVCITLVLILSATMNKLKDIEIWSLDLWKWCVLGLTIFCGHLFSGWWTNIIYFFFLVKNNLPGKHFQYDDLNCRVTIWLYLMLLTWWLLMHPHFSSDTAKVQYYFSTGIMSTLFVVTSWTLKTAYIKLFYDVLYDRKFYQRILENCFHQYMLQTLSGPPFRELSEVIHSSRLVSCSRSNVIDAQKPQRIKLRMIETASQTGFYTLPNTLDESKDLMNPDEQNNRNITTKREAKAAGDLIFRNVAKPGHKYIEEEDLLCFMNKEEVDMVFLSIGGKEESGRISKKSFLNWVVNMYMQSKFLEHSRNDIKKPIMELLIFVNVLLSVVLIISWGIIMGIVTEEMWLFSSSMLSHFVLAVFTFGISVKPTFEAMIFVFLKRPFDVGDRCVIDGVQVLVEEVSIFTTVFLRHDNEKIYYPNSILATKSISNFNRSPEMRDTVEFDLDVSTSVENISALEAKIKTYIDRKPHLWLPKHSVRVREIADENKMRMRLCVTHTLKFQDFEEISDRRSKLVLELRNIFQQVGIKMYQILPPTSSD